MTKGHGMQQNLTLSGRYRLDSLIGRGGMGEVWRATDLRLERAVAVKLLPVDQVGDTPAMRRFEREATAAAALRHRGIAVVFDSGADDESKRVFFVMELLEGEDLQHLLVRTPEGLDPERIRDFGAQIASALAEAHDQGVIHRDIKPANVILMPNGELKICDFGVARTAAHSGSLTKGAIGTPLYMAPEQLRAETVDGRADLYSLGCLLYALATGRPPFKADALPALLYQHMSAEPKPITGFRPDFPAGLDALIMRCLAKDPQDRPGSARELADALGRADTPEMAPSAPTAAPAASVVPVGSAQDSPPATSADSVQSLPLPPHRPSLWPRIGMAAAAVMAVVTASAVTFALTSRGDDDRRILVQQVPAPTTSVPVMPAGVPSSPASSASPRAKKAAPEESSKPKSAAKPTAKPSPKRSSNYSGPRPAHVPGSWDLHRQKAYQGTACTLVGAEYLHEIAAAPGDPAFCTLTSAPIGNVAVDATVNLFDPGCASLATHRGTSSSYEFTLCANGSARIHKRTSSGKPPKLLVTKRAIPPVNGPTRLTAVAQNGTLAFYANGGLLIELQGHDVKAGGIGLGTSVMKDSQASIMSFSKLTVWCGSGSCD